MIREHAHVRALVDAEPEPVSVTWSFPDVPETAWEGLACSGLDGEGRFAPSLGCFLVHIEGQRILCDAGIGPGPNVYLGGLSGRLPMLLEREGLSPSDVDTVVYTHLHMDHVGWAGAFAKAQHHVSKTELAYFLDGAPGTGAHHAKAFEASIRPLLEAGTVTALDDGAVIRPGLRYLPTPGHTPGHQSLLVTSEGGTLCITGDVLHCPAQVERPDWSHRADLDPQAARRSRERLLEQAAEEGWLVAAGHFRPGLQIGRIDRRGEGYVWKPQAPQCSHRVAHVADQNSETTTEDRIR